MPLGLASKGVGLGVKAAQKGLVPAMGAGLAEGAAYGAAYGAGKSEGGVQNRIEGGIGGGFAGGALGAAAPAVVAGVGATAGKLASGVRAITNPTDEAARRVSKALIASDEAAREMRALGTKPLRLDGDPDAQALINAGRAGQDRMLVDTGGDSARRLLRSATNNSPEAEEMAKSVLFDRSAGQTTRAIDFIKGLTGRQGSAYKAGGKLAAEKAAMTDPLYTVARELGDRPIWSKRLEALTGSDTVRSAMQEAAKVVDDRAISQGYGAMNAGVSFENGVMRFTRGADKRAALPNLEFWDQTKRILDSKVKTARQAGDMEAAGRIGEIAKTLRNELDGVVPAYRTARGVAANFFDAEDALDAGQKFALGKFDFDEVADMASKMKPKERDLFEEGFVSAYLNKISGTNDRRDLTKILMSDDKARKSFEVALGPQKTRELEAFLHIEKVMESAKDALGNSTTAKQLRDMGAAGILSGAAGGVSTGGSFDPTWALVGALTKGGYSKTKSAIDNKMAVRIVQMLTSKDPKKHALAIQMAAQPDTLEALRRATAGLTGAAANVGANVAAQREPLRGSQMGQGIREDR
jgi:hypothetical protein